MTDLSKIFPKPWADLLQALTMLAHNRTNDTSPFHCGHDTLTVMSDPGQFTEQELAWLEKVGFFPGEDGTFQSFRYGAA